MRRLKPGFIPPLKGQVFSRDLDKILKNSGFLPPEVEIRKQITHVRELMDQTGQGPTGQASADQAKLHKKLNYLMAKLDAVRSTGPGSTLARDQYRTSLLRKVK